MKLKAIIQELEEQPNRDAAHLVVPLLCACAPGRESMPPEWFARLSLSSDEVAQWREACRVLVETLDALECTGRRSALALVSGGRT